jgi:hypothetical protein
MCPSKPQHQLYRPRTLLQRRSAIVTDWCLAHLVLQDAVSLLWACGQLTRLQQHPGSILSSSTTSTSNSISGSSNQQRLTLFSNLCSHITRLIQYSNNTADIPATYNPQNPNAKAQLLDPWHPEDLTDAAAGLAAAGFRSQVAATLLDAIAHEVYRQLSNRHSAAGSFTVEGAVNLLGSYADLQYKDGELHCSTIIV